MWHQFFKHDTEQFWQVDEDTVSPAFQRTEQVWHIQARMSSPAYCGEKRSFLALCHEKVPQEKICPKCKKAYDKAMRGIEPRT